MNLVKNLKIGQRVRAIKINDPHTRVLSGECGTIKFIDDLETIHVHWDSGASLGIIPEIDEFEIIAHQTQTL